MQANFGAGRDRNPLAQTTYAPAEFDMPSATDDKLEVVLPDQQPLFAKRQMLVIAAVVLAFFVLGGLGIWALLKLDQPVDFPSNTSSQPK